MSCSIWRKLQRSRGDYTPADPDVGELVLEALPLQIKAGEKVYRLELQNDLMSLIARKNKRGREYKDSRNLLNQQVKRRVVEEDDQFLDDEVAAAATSEAPATGKPKAKKAKKRINTALLDVGINHDLD